MLLSLETPAWAEPLLKPVRYKGASGGRGSGKSWFFATELVARCAAYPHTSAVCIREIQKSIRLSSKRLIEQKITELGVSHLFDVTQAEIRHKHGTGIITFQGMQDHTADSIKSLEGFKIAWVEEAQSLSTRSLRLLRPTMRSGSELWFSWNPEFPEDPVEELFANPDDDMVSVKVNWNDNPYFPEELRGEMERDRRIYSPQMWAHIWEGAYITGDMGEVFKWSWFGHYHTPPERGEIIHSWDTAYKAQDHNDPSACTIWRVWNDKAHLLHVFNGRLEYPELKQTMLRLAAEYPPTRVLVEDKASGQSLIQELRGQLPIYDIMPTGDKISRASSCTDVIANGKVLLPEHPKPWLKDYHKQLPRFSFSKELQKTQHDDMVDSTSQFLNWWKTGGSEAEFAAFLRETYKGIR
jgi:predicted phage terminase large subunit-like protein